MNILITGATGFIGSHLAERLAKEGHNVRALVKKEENLPGKKIKKENLELLESLKVEIVYGDLLDKKSLDNAIKGMEVLFHLAAIARPMAIPDKLYFKVNEEGTKNLLEACKNNKKKIKKIIIMSSISAVGPSRDGNPVSENSKCIPADIYGWSKLAQEKVAKQYVKDYNLPIVLLRPPMVFGPRDFELLKLFKAVNKRFFPVSGKKECMEFLFVKNLVEACILAEKKGINGETYHISNGRHYSINEIVHSIESSCRKKVIPIKFPRWSFVIAGYIMEGFARILGFHPPFKHDTANWMTTKFWYSDISKAKKELKYIPKYSLEQGVKETVEYYKEKRLL